MSSIENLSGDNDSTGFDLDLNLNPDDLPINVATCGTSISIPYSSTPSRLPIEDCEYHMKKNMQCPWHCYRRLQQSTSTQFTLTQPTLTQSPSTQPTLTKVPSTQPALTKVPLTQSPPTKVPLTKVPSTQPTSTKVPLTQPTSTKVPLTQSTSTQSRERKRKHYNENNNSEKRNNTTTTNHTSQQIITKSSQELDQQTDMNKILSSDELSKVLQKIGISAENTEIYVKHFMKENINTLNVLYALPYNDFEKFNVKTYGDKLKIAHARAFL